MFPHSSQNQIKILVLDFFLIFRHYPEISLVSLIAFARDDGCVTIMWRQFWEEIVEKEKEAKKGYWLSNYFLGIFFFNNHFSFLWAFTFLIYTWKSVETEHKLTQMESIGVVEFSSLCVLDTWFIYILSEKNVPI